MSFGQLPLDVVAEVITYLPDDDVRNLACSGSQLLSFLQHKAYATITLKEDAVSAESIAALGTGPRHHLVRTLIFSPRDPKPQGGWGPVPVNPHHDDSVRLSPASARILSSLRDHFPNLVEFRLWLDWDTTLWPVLPQAAAAFGQEERGEPWALLLRETFRAFTQSHGAFEALKIKDLPPSFDISLAEVYEQGEGCLPLSYNSILQDVRGTIFGNLPLAEHISISRKDPPSQIQFYYNQSGTYVYVSMLCPNLKTFEFESPYIKIDRMAPSDPTLSEGIQAFLVSHCQTLERINIRQHQTLQGSLEEMLDSTIKRLPQQLGHLENATFPVRQRHMPEILDAWFNRRRG